jgi:hypothetical protein
MHKNNLPHGGKVLLLRSDFRQCLSVVQHGNRVTVLEVTIRNNDTWPQFRQLRLTQNMRTVAGSQYYADWIIHSGNGVLPTYPKLNIPDIIEIPKEFFNYNRSLVEHVFGDPAQLLDPVVLLTNMQSRYSLSKEQ